MSDRQLQYRPSGVPTWHDTSATLGHHRKIRAALEGLPDGSILTTPDHTQYQLAPALRTWTVRRHRAHLDTVHLRAASRDQALRIAQTTPQDWETTDIPPSWDATP